MGRKKKKVAAKSKKVTRKVTAGRKSGQGSNSDGNGSRERVIEAAAAAAIQEMNCRNFPLVVLKVILESLKLEELKEIRLVCTDWNRGVVDCLLSKGQRFHIRFLKDDIKLTKFMSIPKPRLDDTLFRLTKFEFKGVAFDSNLTLHADFLRLYGRVILQLHLNVVTVSNVLDIYQACPNLVSLELGIHVRTESDAVGEITGQVGEMMKNLKSITMTYNVNWNFGDFLNTVAPNVEIVKCTARIPRSADAKTNFYHFAKQMTILKTEKIRHFEYNARESDGDNPSAYSKLAEAIWPALKTATMSPKELWKGCIIPSQFWLFLSKIARTIENLNFGPDDEEDELNISINDLHVIKVLFNDQDKIPELPEVTVANIPHCLVTSSDFFQKMPALQKLRLGYNRWNLLKRSDIKDGLPVNLDNKSKKYWGRSRCGFYRGNLGMWQHVDDDHQEDSGIFSHEKLHTLELRLSALLEIPKTITSIFPNMRILIVEVRGHDSFEQLTNLMDIINSHPLDLFHIVVKTRYSFFMDKLAFVLMGITQESWVKVRSMPMNTWNTLVTNTSIRTMSQLKMFKMENIAVNYYDEVKSMLEMHCFGRMKNLKEWVLVKQE